MCDSSSSDDEICFGPLTLEECKKYLRAPLKLPSKITIRKPQQDSVVDREKENCLGLANLSIDNVSKHNNSLKILSKDVKSKTDNTNNFETIEISSDEEAFVEIFDQNEEGKIKKDCSPNAEIVLNNTQNKNDSSSFRSSVCDFTADSLDVRMDSKDTDFSKDSLQISTKSTNTEQSLKVVYFKQLNYEQKKLETSASEYKTNSSVSDNSQQMTVNSVFSDSEKEDKKLNQQEKFETSVTLIKNKNSMSKIDDSLVENVSVVDDVLKTNDSETVKEIVLRQSNFADGVEASDSKGNSDESKNTQEIISEDDETNKTTEENAESENNALITAGKLFEKFYENINSDVHNFTSGLKILPEIKPIEITSENVSPNVSSHLFLENIFENCVNASKSTSENIFVEKIPEKSITNIDLKNNSANDSSCLFLKKVFENSGNASITKKYFDNSYKHNLENSLSEVGNNSQNSSLKNVSSMDSLNILSPSMLNNTTFSQSDEVFYLKTKQIEKETELSDITEIPMTSKSETSSLIHLLSDLENSGKNLNLKFSEQKDEKMILNKENSDRNNFESSNSSSQNTTSDQNISATENCTQDYECSKDGFFDYVSASNAVCDAYSYLDRENANNISVNESTRFDNVFENVEEVSENIFMEKISEKSTTNIEFKNICSKHPSRLFLNVCENSGNASKSMSEDIFMEKIPGRSATNIKFKNISANESPGLFLENVCENSGNSFKGMAGNIFIETTEGSAINIETTKNISANNSSRLFLENVFENCGNASKSMSETIFIEKIPERSADIETLKLGRLKNVEYREIVPGSGFDFANSMIDDNNKTTEYCTDKNDDFETLNDLLLPKIVSVERVPKTTFQNTDESLNSASDFYLKESKLLNDCESSESRCIEKCFDVLNTLKNTSSSSWETVSDGHSKINKEKSESKNLREDIRQSENLNISISDLKSVKSTWKTISYENLNDLGSFRNEIEHCVSFEKEHESSNSVRENCSSVNVQCSNESNCSNLFHKESDGDSFKFSDSFESHRTSDFNTSGELNDTMEAIERLIRMQDISKQTGVNPAQSESSKYQNTNTPLQNEQKQNSLSVTETLFNQKQMMFTTKKTPVPANINEKQNSTVKNKIPLEGMANSKSPLRNAKNKTPVQGKINAKTPISIGKQTAVAKTPSMEDNIIQKTPDVKQSKTYNRFRIGEPRTGATRIASYNNKPIDPRTDIGISNTQNVKKTDQLLNQTPSDIKNVTGTLKKSQVLAKGHESNFKSLLRKPQLYGSHSEVFKTPTPRLKKPKSPLQYDNIVSPIGLYIHKSSTPVLMSNAKSKNIDGNGSLKAECTAVQQTGPVGGCLPHRVYSKPTKVDETTEQDQVLPQSIRELFPSKQQVVIKHVGRFKSRINTVELDYSLNDSVMQLANSSAVANPPGLADVSVHVALSGIRSPRVIPMKK